jgi:hypothetical protein
MSSCFFVFISARFFLLLIEHHGGTFFRFLCVQHILELIGNDAEIFEKYLKKQRIERWFAIEDGRIKCSQDFWQMAGTSPSEHPKFSYFFHLHYFHEFLDYLRLFWLGE